MHTLVFTTITINLLIKFEIPNFTPSKGMMGRQKLKMEQVTVITLISE